MLDRGEVKTVQRQKGKKRSVVVSDWMSETEILKLLQVHNNKVWFDHENWELNSGGGTKRW